MALRPNGPELPELFTTQRCVYPDPRPVWIRQIKPAQIDESI